jgi:hypothetical protein
MVDKKMREYHVFFEDGNQRVDVKIDATEQRTRGSADRINQ